MLLLVGEQVLAYSASYHVAPRSRPLMPLASMPVLAEASANIHYKLARLQIAQPSGGTGWCCSPLCVAIVGVRRLDVPQGQRRAAARPGGAAAACCGWWRSSASCSSSSAWKSGPSGSW